MKLNDYLTFTGKSAAAFGREIGVKRQSVHRYMQGHVPRWKIIMRIHAATSGMVSVSDWIDATVKARDDVTQPAA